MRILLVRLREIGDVVFTTPAVHALRDRFQDAHIDYLVEPAASPVVTGSPYIDDVIVAPRGRGLPGFASDVALGRQLRRHAYALAIDFHGGPRASLLTWLSGATERIGYAVPGRAWMYTRRVPRARTAAGRHSVINQWALLESLGVPAPDPDQYPTAMALDADSAGDVATRLAGAGASTSDRLIVMHVSAGNPFRRWPPASFAAVAAALAGASADRRVLVTSGPSEREAAAGVIAEARQLLAEGQRERILAAGEFSLAELRALVDRAALYVGGDSGPAHVASTSRVPIVTLYGPTLPERSRPWRRASIRSAAVETHGLVCRPCDQRRCEPGDFRCLTHIEPRQVIEAAERLLQ
ncbi:MAG TPA: glycosyltransferase family 9 protein [Vicinamibacterales bacterium]|jgi:lipopolysaccharide heptosyltransferase II|nr:glycosyltransferase family 9 protein [Vicinamibacterales bacterium]